MDIKFKYPDIVGPKYNYTLSKSYWKLNVPKRRDLYVKLNC